MHLHQALDIRLGEMAALIGAGGKTTTMFRVAQELRAEGRKVLATTTTKIFQPRKPHVDRLFLVDDIDSFAEICRDVPAPVVLGAGTSVGQDGKLLGLLSAWLDRLSEANLLDAILVEADGAASRVFKVPGDDEPVIPERCHLVIWLMALGVLGKPLDGTWIHRAERAIALLSRPAGTIVTEDHIVRLVQHPVGCWKGIPPTSRKVAVINQVDAAADVAQALALGKRLLASGADRVVLSSQRQENSIIDVLQH